MAETIETRTLTRQELYELVWKTPVRRLATQFGISDVGLAKTCKRHQIPTPPTGYWAKKAHGKIVRRASLPPCDDVTLATVTIGGNSAADGLTVASEKPSLASTFFDPELGRLAEAEARGEKPIVVPDALRSPHPLVTRTREGLIAASQDQHYQRQLVLFPQRADDQCCLDVQVGRKNIGRAMRIMDALIKGLEERDYKVGVPGQRWQRGMLVEALGGRWQIRIREPTVRKNHEPTEKEREWLKKYPRSSSVPQYDYALSDRLLVELQRGSGWSICTLRDGKKQRVEDNLVAITLAMLRDADDDRRRAVAAAEEARKRAEIERQRREEEERRRQEEQRRKEEQTRIDSLFADAAQWDRCGQVRKYLSAIKELAIERYGFINPDGNVGRWLRWAEDAVERNDPLVAVSREIDAILAAQREAECSSGLVNKPR